MPARSPWGASYHQTYLFADWGCDRIFVLGQGQDGRFTARRLVDDLSGITALLFSPDGDTLSYAYEAPEGGSQVGAMWHCPTYSLVGVWPPACLWGSDSTGAPDRN